MAVVKMGKPWHLVEEKAEAAGVIAYTSNYALYADFSNPAMSTLADNEITP